MGSRRSILACHSVEVRSLPSRVLTIPTMTSLSLTHTHTHTHTHTSLPPCTITTTILHLHHTRTTPSHHTHYHHHHNYLTPHHTHATHKTQPSSLPTPPHTRFSFEDSLCLQHKPMTSNIFRPVYNLGNILPYLLTRVKRGFSLI